MEPWSLNCWNLFAGVGSSSASCASDGSPCQFGSEGEGEGRSRGGGDDDACDPESCQQAGRSSSHKQCMDVSCGLQTRGDVAAPSPIPPFATFIPLHSPLHGSAMMIGSYGISFSFVGIIGVFLDVARGSAAV